MSESKHTPGPWHTENDGPDSHTITANTQGGGGPWKLIAELCQTDMASAQCTSEEIEANARLIAAAPDLLEACRRSQTLIESVIERWPQSFLQLDSEAYNVMAAAIAKATGQE